MFPFKFSAFFRALEIELIKSYEKKKISNISLNSIHSYFHKNTFKGYILDFRVQTSDYGNDANIEFFVAKKSNNIFNSIAYSDNLLNGTNICFGEDYEHFFKYLISVEVCKKKFLRF